MAPTLAAACQVVAEETCDIDTTTAATMVSEEINSDEEMHEAVRRLIECVGEDAEREGLVDTPQVRYMVTDYDLKIIK